VRQSGGEVIAAGVAMENDCGHKSIVAPAADKRKAGSVEATNGWRGASAGQRAHDTRPSSGWRLRARPAPAGGVLSPPPADWAAGKAEQEAERHPAPNAATLVFRHDPAQNREDDEPGQKYKFHLTSLLI